MRALLLVSALVLPFAASAGPFTKSDKLAEEQKYQAALDATKAALGNAIQARDEKTQTEALLRATRLEIALGGYETALKFFREASRPKDPALNALLELYYAYSLRTYQESYSWEIARREKSGAPDLKSWTTLEIGQEIGRAFDGAIKDGPWLDEEVPALYGDYIKLNSYPKGVRSSLRDVITYLAVEFFLDQQFWGPREAFETFKLGAVKLAVNPPGERFDAASIGVHPLERASSWLADLERRHDQRGEREAALEARYERFRALHGAFTEASDRAALLAALRESQGKTERVRWWARGQALAAEFLRETDLPDRLIQARAEAVAGRDAFPDSVPGKMCAAIVSEIERPGFSFFAMANDAAAKRSVLVSYRNLRRAYFRAYPVNFEARLQGFQGAALSQLNNDELEKLLRSGSAPAAAWSAELAESKDFLDHRYFVTPPPLAPGLYQIVASLNEDFGPLGNVVQAAPMFVSGLVLGTRSLGDGSIETRALDGDSGQPVAGAKISLYRYSWQQKLAEVKTLVADAKGFATFRAPPKDPRSYLSYLFVARHGKDLAVERDHAYFSAARKESDVKSALLYTDRAVYRPGQKILFKVVAYSGSPELGHYQTAKAGTQVSVRLLDSGYQEVAARKLVVNAFGSASGEFEIPAGRPLGDWMVQSLGNAGGASVKVEEYKRPTFEASILEAKEPLRLNHAARLTGEAKYYFGLPVTGGKVSWRVVRTEIWPWWWDLWGSWRGQRRGGQLVASGTASVGKDGAFPLEFRAEADERRKGEPGLSYNFEIIADVTDEGGETRSASRKFRLGFTSVEAKLSWDEGFFFAGRPATLRAQLTNLDGNPRAGEGHYRISRLAVPEAGLPADLPRDETPSSPFALPDDHRRARWETEFRWEAVTHAWKEAGTIAEGRVQHDEKGEGRILFPASSKGGVYRVTYVTKDSYGESFEVSRDLLVGGAARLGLPLVVVPEFPARKVGETARFFIASGLKGQPLWVEVFRGGKRVSKRPFAGGVLEVPVSVADRGGFTVMAGGVRDHQALRAEARQSVPWVDRELKVEFSTFRDTLSPGQKETFRISVRNDAGKLLARGAAEVLATMYDRSLDLFAPYNPPKVASLYPSREATPPQAWSIGEALTSTLRSALPAPVSPPGLRPDEFSYYPSYGVGGPGNRGRHGPVQAMMALAEQGPTAARTNAEPGVGAAAASMTHSPAPAPAPPEVRANFAENAFFAPHLLLDSRGTAAIEFTAPESVTGWRVIAQALTRDLRGGAAEREVRTVKELVVRPYAPRFLREGDAAEVKVQVSNAGEKTMSGELSFDVEEGGKSALREFGVKDGRKPFRVEKGRSETFTFSVRAPKKGGDFAFRVSARAGAFTDGELRAFPVLPSRLHLTQSRFAALRGKGKKTLEFADLAKNDDPTRVNERLSVTVDAQLFYGVLAALPFLVDYPYESVEESLNRFVSTGILTSLFGKYPSVAAMAKQVAARGTPLERFDAPDVNRSLRLEETPWLAEGSGGAKGEDPLLHVLNPEVARKQREISWGKITQAQLPSGAFPWFQGGPPDEHMTLYVLLSLARALEFKVDVPRAPVAKAWGYVHDWLEDHLADLEARDTGWETITFVNFALSSYPDASWTGGAFDRAAREKLLAFSFKHWKEHSPLLKGYLALTLKRLKREKDARLVWESVMDSAKHDDQLGTYWAREDRSWLWYNDDVETQAFALRTQMELDGRDLHNEGLVQWLFLNKKLNHWKSTRATAEVIYALAHYLSETGELGVAENVKVEAAGHSTLLHFDPAHYTGKKNQIVVPAPGGEAAKVEVSKDSPGFAFASATWAFSTERMPEEERGDFFSVSRRYFKRVQNGAGFDLRPLTDGAELAVGDELEVHLSLRTKHEAEYVHLRDPRGAGFEPETLSSGWKWDLGISWYEETRDSGSNFFFSRLPVGEYTFRYRLRASMAGKFRVGPATVQSLYAPEFNAYSAGNVVEIR